MEKSSEIDQLKRALEVADSEKRDYEENWKSKLDALSLERSMACEEVNRLQMELASLKKEQGDLLCRIKEQEQGSCLSNDLQENKLQLMTDERDKLKAQSEELLGNEVKLKHIGQCYEEKLLTAQNEAENLSRRLAELERKMHDDEVKHNKERTKVRMRLQSTQAKLDAFREKYKEAIVEQEFMHKKFEEASTKLKERLASSGIQILDLQKQLAATKS